MAETPKKVVIELRREICFCSGGVDGATSSSKEVIQNHQPSKDAIPKHNSTAARLAKHARSSSGGGLLSNIIAPPPVAHTKYKSESTEALIITPPPLSNASTMSSLSTYMPATPPSNIPTPGEYTDATSESYFGVFSKSSSHAKQQQHHHQYQHTYVPPPPIPITLPSSITRSQSHNHSHDNGNNKKRKDELTTLATFEIDCLFTNSNWQGKIKSSLPKSKSIYHYALGETCSTLFANSKFYLVPKIQYKNQKNFIELQKVEIFLSIVSNEERKKAIEMKGKILAIQKAEARLFGGDDEHIENGKNDQSYNERQRKQPANIARSTHTLKGTSSSSNSSDQQKVRPTSQSSRIRISQSVSPKVGTGGIASASASSSPQVNASETEEDDMPRLSTVRRRSEQGDLSLETPSRTRQRFGSTSDLSPVVGSPYLNTVSPSLSVISSSTSRPRTANGRSRPTTANSTKSITSFAGIGASRPKSSAGLEHAATSSAWSTFSNASTANFTVDPAAAVAILQISSSQTTNTASSSALSSCTPSSCTPSEPPSLSSKTSSSGSITSSIDLSPKSCSSGKDNLFPEQKLDTLKIENPFQYSPVTPAAVNGLFADFSGFSLRPPVISLSDTNTSIKKEESIHPRAMFPHDKISSYKRNSSHKVAVTLEKPSSIPGMVTNNKRKSGEVMDYALEEEEVGSLHDSSAASSNSSPVIALHEVTLASPPASVNMNPNNASQNSFLSPMTIQHNARSTSMKKIGSHDSHASSSINAPMGMSVHSKQQQQDVGLGSPKRGKGGMSGAFAFFRRSSTRT